MYNVYNVYICIIMSNNKINKIITLDNDTKQKLSIKAVLSGVSLKMYIEKLLIKHVKK